MRVLCFVIMLLMGVASVYAQDWKPMPIETVQSAKKWDEQRWYDYMNGMQETVWTIAMQFRMRGNWWESEYALWLMSNFWNGMLKHGSMRKYAKALMVYVGGLGYEHNGEPLIKYVMGKKGL